MSSREYKSDVFSLLMENKNYALEVYNALNGSNYENPEEVEIIQLEKGVSLSIRNDASFIIDMNINFYEHQSTYNPNMPLRSLIYYVNDLEEWIKKQEIDLLRGRRIQIPTPHFVVFYNGLKKRPEYEEMKLSDSFYHATDSPELEIKCRVYNINPPYNQQLVRQSKVLEGYTYFVERVRSNQSLNMEIEEAVGHAIDDCIEKNILGEFFSEKGDEIRKMTHLDFTWEKREKLIRKEEFEDGKQEGKQEGIATSILDLLAELGTVTETLSERIKEERDMEQLRKWNKLAAKSTSIEEFEQQIS